MRTKRLTEATCRPEQAHTTPPIGRGFTLIEMLVVIGIIGILAGIILTVAPGVVEKRTRSTVQAELARLTAAIDVYRAEKGFYPPSDPTKRYNSLFYELTGATNTSPAAFTSRLLATNVLTDNEINSTFGVGGVINADESGGKNYLGGLRQESYKPIVPNAAANTPFVLVAPAKGTNEALPNVWYYDPSSPDRHNKNSYDLWAVMKVGSKILHIGNWKD